MRVLKQQGDASQEGYRGRLKSPQRDQYHAGKTRHGKSPKIRSKPLGPCFAAGKEHQREYGHGHASPDPRVKASSEKNKIPRPKVHGTRGGRRRRHDRFRLRFRLVSPVPAHSDNKPGAPIQHCSIDECSFSGKTSLAAGNRHGHVPPRESGGTRVNLKSENETGPGPMVTRPIGCFIRRVTCHSRKRARFLAIRSPGRFRTRYTRSRKTALSTSGSPRADGSWSWSSPSAATRFALSVRG